MRRTIIGTVAVAALAMAGLASAPSAQAAIPAHCTPAFSVTPVQYNENRQTINVGVVPLKVTFSVALTVPAGEFNDCPAVTRWELVTGDDVNGGGDRNLYAHVSNASPNFTIAPARLENHDSGDAFEVEYAYKADGSWFYGNTDLFTVKRATTWNGTNASPEPAIKGNHILVRSTLTRANWESLKFAPYAGRSVRYQNRDVDGGPYVFRGFPVLTNNAGFASTSTKADITRGHRLVFQGNGQAGASAAKGDVVEVLDN